MPQSAVSLPPGRTLVCLCVSVFVSISVCFTLFLSLCLPLSSFASFYSPPLFQTSSQDLLKDSGNICLHSCMPPPHLSGSSSCPAFCSQIPHKSLHRKGRGPSDITLCRRTAFLKRFQRWQSSPTPVLWWGGSRPLAWVQGNSTRLGLSRQGPSSAPDANFPTWGHSLPFSRHVGSEKEAWVVWSSDQLCNWNLGNMGFCPYHPWPSSQTCLLPSQFLSPQDPAFSRNSLLNPFTLSYEDL